MLVYIDDIIIYSTMWEDHLKHVHLIFSILAEIEFTVDEKKNVILDMKILICWVIKSHDWVLLCKRRKWQ